MVSIRRCIAVAGLLCVVGCARDVAPVAGVRLKYSVQRLGNARTVDVVSPGGAKTANCFRVTHELGSWSRVNWPRFEPVAGLEYVSFRVRRNGPTPKTLRVRVEREDGTEWQSDDLELSASWRLCRLTADDFVFYRGGTPETAGPLSFSDVVQFQLVPSSGGTGDGQLLVDEIELGPGGPRFTAESAELEPIPNPEQARIEGVADLVRRWKVEETRTKRLSLFADHWLEDLSAFRKLWTNDGERDALNRRLLEREFAWQRQPGRAELLQIVSEPSTQTIAGELERRTQQYAGRPVTGLVDFSVPVKADASKLYAAPVPAAPEVVEEGGNALLRQRVSFTGAESRQTVFCNITLPSPVDVRKNVIAVRMRWNATALSEKKPLRLRVWTLGASGQESWADLVAEPLPGTAWTEVTFDPTMPVSGTHFHPSEAFRLSFRVENQPGRTQDITLDIDDIRLSWPDPAVEARRSLIREQLDRVHDVRLKLYRRLDAIAAAESALASDQALRRTYLRSFIQQAADSTPQAAVPTSVLGDIAAPARDLHPDWIVTRTVLLETGAALRVETDAAAETFDTIAAELYGPAGTLVASARQDASATGVVSLDVQQALLWQPRHPALYRLKAALLKDGKTVAWTDRECGLRTVGCCFSGPDAMLRHVASPREPDCSMLWNGAPYFPHGARYSWPREAETFQEGVALYGDLWMEAQRDYGFRFSAGACERWSRHGLLRYASYAPSYRNLTGWGDVSHFLRNYQARLRPLRRHRDQPLAAVTQIGNEVELAMWGSDLSAAFPDGLYHPLDIACQTLGDQLAPTSPIMYVRAGSFRKVPPLPFEDVCGVNQYTGRYHGRNDEIRRDLAEFGREALLTGRPLMITEWNGPKYSWASSGIGGCTRRGAAYHIEQYYRGMVNTPGIVGSSEFTLNWIIAPFEDFTTQTREQAMVDRPKHHKFGGGYTADHVPLVDPTQAVHGPCFRAMQAFQSPFYMMCERPGAIRILATQAAAQAAVEIADPLRKLGKTVEVSVLASSAALPVDGHTLLLFHPADSAPLATSLAAQGIIEPPSEHTDVPGEPLIQRRVSPANPDGLLVSVSAVDVPSFERGIARCADSARSLLELRQLESAMTRAVALTDSRLVRAYGRYILEFAARGYLFGGDDVRTSLSSEEFYSDGARRPAWQRLSAVILDCSRELTAAELALVDRFVSEGVNVIISLPCYRANSALRSRYPATVGRMHSLAETFPLAEAVCGPIPVTNLGGADLAAIERFCPNFIGQDALEVAEIAAQGATPLAETSTGASVAVAWQKGDARVCLLGAAFGAVARMHWSVTHAGETHGIYDRDTACGLERLSRVVVNCARLGQTDSADVQPRLFLRVAPESTIAAAGAPIRASLRLTDVEGNPVAGQLRVRSRLTLDGSHKRDTPYRELVPTGPGCYALHAEAGPDPFAAAVSLDAPIQFQAPPADSRETVLVTFQFKAYAPGYIPADSALCVVVEQ